ncbi:MAG TPA: hypothetical protein VLA29_07100 [Acidimicrobiia bacterium]|nr:hypothetical protein [Acidimicrobiia bacterium]
MTAAAVIAVVLLAVIGVFQIALALGAPLGSAAWSGQHEGVLPIPLRIASGVAAVVVYPLIIIYVLAASGLVDLDWMPIRSLGMWVLTAFFGIGAVVNLASRSRVERLWAPVSLVIAVCCAIIALGM